jgi:hypothetical protein
MASRTGDLHPVVDERLAPVTGGLATTTSVLADARQLVDWLKEWQTLPTRVTQLASLAMVASQGDAHVYVVCRSTNAVAPGQTFTPSQFHLSCRLMPDTGGVHYDLEMSADGSGWVDYRYHGELTRAGAPAWIVRSQSMQVLGAGHFRGFEVVRGETQEAAVAFYEDPTWDSTTSTSNATPRAWWRPQSTPADTRVLHLMTGLLHAYPFPGVCEAAIINERALAPLQ